MWTSRHFSEDSIVHPATGPATVSLMHPDLVRHVLENRSGHFGLFAKSLHCHDLILSERLAAHPTLMPSMSQFSGQALGQVFSVMETEASLLADRLAARPHDGPEAIEPMISTVIGGMIQRSLLMQVPETQSSQLIGILHQSLEASGALDALKYLGAPDWLPLLSEKTHQGIQNRLHTLARILVTRRREHLAEQPGGGPHDLIGALIASWCADMTDDKNDEAITTLLIAILATCYATSQRSLVWALALLAATPDIQSRCASEAHTLLAQPAPLSTVIDQASLIRAVIKETIRLYPPVPVIRRQVLADHQVGDLKLAQGSMVLIAPWVLHRHSAFWQDPMSFRPERFTGPAGQASPPYTYLPFGGGEQTCIGFGYMMQATCLVLIALLNQLSFGFEDGETMPLPLQRVGLVPQSPIRLLITRRM